MSKRSLIAALVDQLFGRLNKLPPETTSYTTTSLRIPLPPSPASSSSSSSSCPSSSPLLSLSATLYQPTASSSSGTILVRSPYGITGGLSLSHARVFAARGYTVLLSSCRGTGLSDGEFDPGRNETADSRAVVEWMRRQDWYTGMFATLGTSYLGLTQWALLNSAAVSDGLELDDMVAATINTGPHHWGWTLWGTGAPAAAAIVSWADMLAKMRGGMSELGMLWYLRSQEGRIRPVVDSVPLLAGVDTHFDNKTPAWVRGMLTHPDVGGEYWAPLDLLSGALVALARMPTPPPILLTAGWYDLVMPAVMEQYARLVERRWPVGLTIGPWAHLGASGRNSLIEIFGWMERHLAGRAGCERQAPVRVYLTGAEQWHHLPKWPPPSSPRELFLSPGNLLSDEPPSARGGLATETAEDGDDGAASTFWFSPEDPTPAVGVPQMFDNGFGAREPNTALAGRDDVLTFTYPVLTEDLEVSGRPHVTLYHSSDPPYADVLVVLSDVDAGGTSYSISEKFIRLANHQGPLHLDLNDCAHVFRKGNRVQLLVAGGSHPRYIRNPGTGDSPAEASTMRPVVHSIGHSSQTPSKLVVPISTLAKSTSTSM